MVAAPSGERIPSDAFVFFGATGDLAKRKIYPALQALIRKGELNVPLVCIARASHTLESLTATIRDSLERFSDFDETSFQALVGRLRLVTGDYGDPGTYTRLCEALAGANRPVVYLAIPPSLFESVASGLSSVGCAKHARIVIEKPFGRDLASAKALDDSLHAHFPERNLYRIDHYLGKEPVQNLIYFHLANAIVDGSFNRSYVERVEITMAETLGMEGRGKFYEEVGAIRDVMQNHMLQVVACLALECPVGRGEEDLRDEMARVIRSIRPATAKDLVRGQYQGYRNESGVAPDSKVETFAAVRLYIDNERWNGVPFYIRVGKRMPVTSTEVFVKYRDPLWAKVMRDGESGAANYTRLRVSPDVQIAQGIVVKNPGTAFTGTPMELVAKSTPPEARLAYERLFHDAFHGNPELFARGDMILAQWRVVDGLLGEDAPLHSYEAGSWGPAETGRLLGEDRWHDPAPTPSAAKAIPKKS